MRGSSREHAPWSISGMGIRCIISSSFADIFFNNCFKNGILPVTLPAEQVEALAAHRVDCLHAVGGDGREVGQRDLGEVLRRGERALVELLEDREHERLLVGVALELVEHLHRAPRDLGRVCRPLRGELEQEQQQPRVEVQRLAVGGHVRRLSVAAVEAIAHAEVADEIDHAPGGRAARDARGG